MQAQTKAAIAQGRCGVLSASMRRPSRRADRAFADLVRRSRQARDRDRQQGEGTAGRPAARSLCARARRPGRDLGRARRGPGRSLRGAAQSAAADGRARKIERARRDVESRRRSRSASRWSGGRMPASRPWSTGCIGEDRLLTGPEAGITRDAIAVDLHGGARPSASTTPRACAGGRGCTRSSKSSRSPTRLKRSASPKSWWCLVDAETAFEEQDLRIADLVAVKAARL